MNLSRLEKENKAIKYRILRHIRNLLSMKINKIIINGDRNKIVSVFIQLDHT